MNTTLWEKRAFADVSKLRILTHDHPGLSMWTLNPVTSVLIKDTEGINRGQVHVKTETEVAVIQLQTKEQPEPLEDGSSKKGFSPRDLEGVRSCQHADVQFPVSRTMRE